MKNLAFIAIKGRTAGNVTAYACVKSTKGIIIPDLFSLNIVIYLNVIKQTKDVSTR